ncbi:hypothetical protein [Methanogenium cariaci]|uniref:hypothetical protein n=1 Tax=Methanogenium cariaci TaxID=2197 RepID=UPI001C47E7B6|nr:hypothetical protein [Methanogenium cariaci]
MGGNLCTFYSCFSAARCVKRNACRSSSVFGMHSWTTIEGAAVSSMFRACVRDNGRCWSVSTACWKRTPPDRGAAWCEIRSGCPGGCVPAEESVSRSSGGGRHLFC